MAQVTVRKIERYIAWFLHPQGRKASNVDNAGVRVVDPKTVHIWFTIDNITHLYMNQSLNDAESLCLFYSS